MLFGLIFAVSAVRTEIPLYHWRFTGGPMSCRVDAFPRFRANP